MGVVILRAGWSCGSAGQGARQSHVVHASSILPRPVLREKRAELATAREAGGGEGDFDDQVLGWSRDQVLAPPTHTSPRNHPHPTLSRSTGRGNLPHTCDRPAPY